MDIEIEAGFGGGDEFRLEMRVDWRVVRRWGWRWVGMSLRVKFPGNVDVVAVEVGDQEEGGVRGGWGVSPRLRVTGDGGGLDLG